MDIRKEPELGNEPNNQPRHYPHVELERPPPPNYVAWIIAGAISALLVAVAISEYEIYRAKQIITEVTTSAQRFGQQATAQMNAQMADQRARSERQQQAQMAQERDRRATDPNGARLGRQCSEWTAMADGVKKSDYATQERGKFCGQLNAYVIHGTLPRP